MACTIIRLRYPWRVYLASFLTAAAYLVITFAMRGRIVESYNAVSSLPWLYVSFLGGFTVATSAFLTRSHAKADENAISLTSPRSRVTLNAADFVVPYTASAVLPLALSFTAAVITSTAVSHRGYLDLSYIPSALAFLGALVVLGQTLPLLVPHRILAILGAFIAGQFLGLYAGGARLVIDNWVSASSQAWIFLVPLLFLALAARSAFAANEHRMWMSRGTAGAFLVVFFVAFYLLSPIELTTERQ